MTLVMVWTDGSDRWWIVSDSRLSGPYNRITDSAAKILEIPVTLYEPGGNDPLGAAIKRTTLGFAYVGSSLVALQAYAAVLPLWSRLQSAPFNVLPTMQEFANNLAYFVSAFSKDVEAGCQCFLFGLDSPSEALDGWEITAKDSGPCDVRRIVKHAGIATYGTGADRAREWLNYLKGDAEFPQWRRAPIQLLRQMMQNDEVATVGGAVQIGVLTNKGFEVYFDAVIRPDMRIPEFKWRGFDVQDVSRIGRCIAIIRGTS